MRLGRGKNKNPCEEQRVAGIQGMECHPELEKGGDPDDL
jgi:hypothetical protein